MATADDDDGVFEFAGSFEAGEQDTDGGIEGLGFTEIVGKVSTDFGDVGEEGGEFSLEGIGSIFQRDWPEPRTHLRWTLVGPNQ